MSTATYKIDCLPEFSAECPNHGIGHHHAGDNQRFKKHQSLDKDASHHGNDIAVVVDSVLSKPVTLGGYYKDRITGYVGMANGIEMRTSGVLWVHLVCIHNGTSARHGKNVPVEDLMRIGFVEMDISNSFPMC